MRSPFLQTTMMATTQEPQHGARIWRSPRWDFLRHIHYLSQPSLQSSFHHPFADANNRSTVCRHLLQVGHEATSLRTAYGMVSVGRFEDLSWAGHRLAD